MRSKYRWLRLFHPLYNGAVDLVERRTTVLSASVQPDIVVWFFFPVIAPKQPAYIFAITMKWPSPHKLSCYRLKRLPGVWKGNVGCEHSSR
jgi:hypothetical protein